jgi:hypothetical protein
VSTTDTDSRSLLVQGQVVEISYNVQAAVDEKHKLVVATHTINRNDRNALSRAAQEAKENIEAEELTVIADKGYHNGRELQTTQKAGISTIVAMAELVNSNDHGTQPDYIVSKFTYNKDTDTSHDLLLYTLQQPLLLVLTSDFLLGVLLMVLLYHNYPKGIFLLQV